METIYFFVFCVANAFVIFWCLRFDDQASFKGEEKNKKFSPTPVKRELRSKEEGGGQNIPRDINSGHWE